MHVFRNRIAGASAAFAVAFVLLGMRGGAAVADAPAGKAVDRIRCDEAEGAVLHVHQHLTIFDHGKPVPIPGDVGRPFFAPCLYWLHTHAADGIVHIESPVAMTFTLGNFFDVWGEPLSATRVGSVRVQPGRLVVYVNSRPVTGNPRKIELTDHADITLEAGPPYHKPPAFSAWNGQ